jgi:hypothetical protein
MKRNTILTLPVVAHLAQRTLSRVLVVIVAGCAGAVVAAAVVLEPTVGMVAAAASARRSGQMPLLLGN